MVLIINLYFEQIKTKIVEITSQKLEKKVIIGKGN